MITVPGYQTLHIVYEDDSISIVHAFSMRDQQVVLIKAVKEGPRMMIENAKMIHEYELLSRLDIPRLLKPCSLFRHENAMVLLFDIIESITLRHYMSMRAVSLDAFFDIAVSLLDTAARLHDRNIVHMNLRPETILLKPDSLEVWLTGFNDAVSQQQLPFSSWSDGSPPYMAPERTGRIRNTVDARTDLYSLGVVFYEMLSGCLPFQAGSPLEWAYAHAAKQPSPLRGIEHIPPLLADIVMKLIAKHPDERYQSAFGVSADLMRCREAVRSGTEADFELGAYDAWKTDGARRASDEADPDGGKPLSADAQHNLPDSVMTVRSMPLRQGGAQGTPQSGYAQMLDLSAVLHASRSFVQQPDLEQLVAELLKIAMETAGAERALLMTRQGDDWSAEHVSQSLNGWSMKPMAQPLKEYASIIHTAALEAVRTAQHMVIDNAETEPGWANDPYVKAQRLKSALVFPIKLQDSPPAVLYMENRLTAGAFSGRHLDMLHMLSVQIVYMKRLQTATSRPAALPPATTSLLSKRELAVLQRMASGMSNKEIAAQLDVTSETVKAHIKKIFDKLNVNRRAQAVLTAVKLNILHSEDYADEAARE